MPWRSKEPHSTANRVVFSMMAGLAVGQFCPHSAYSLFVSLRLFYSSHPPDCKLNVFIMRFNESILVHCASFQSSLDWLIHESIMIRLLSLDFLRFGTFTPFKKNIATKFCIKRKPFYQLLLYYVLQQNSTQVIIFKKWSFKYIPGINITYFLHYFKIKEGVTLPCTCLAFEIWENLIFNDIIFFQGVTKRCRLSLLTNSALAIRVTSPNAGGGGELRGLSQWIQLCTSRDMEPK